MFEELIKRFFDGRAQQRKANLFVLQGFGTGFLNEMSASSGIGYILGAWTGEYPALPASAERRGSLVSALASFKKTAWCLYEDFTQMCLADDAFTGRRFAVTVVRNDIFGVDGKNVFYPIPSAASDPDVYSGEEMIDGMPFRRFINRHFKLDIGIDCTETGFYGELADDKSQPSDENAVEIPVSQLDAFAAKLQLGLVAPGSYVCGSSALSEGFTARIRALSTLGACIGVNIACAQEKAPADDDDRYVQVLRDYWGENAAFRTCRFYKDPGQGSGTEDISQGRVINGILDQCDAASGSNGASYSDVIVTAPTGSGKSVFFQVPGIHLHRTRGALTIVICPLIALMVDQVRELNERGVDFATYINGSITFEERQERIEGIKSGKYSIVYLAPELLLAGEIEDIIGTRGIGLFVVDEAHLVTSWGRDFRVDYWFLGDYTEKLRKKYRFPVLCLTATAVYGGSDDVVHDLIRSMHLNVYHSQMHIGFVRRDDIMFMVRKPQKNGRSDRKVKNSAAAQQIANAVRRRRKTIVYFPFKSQIDEIRNTLRDEQPGTVVKTESYSGDMLSLDKDKSYNNFRDGTAPVMLATKAFGMGVNIDDIGVVYHYAPTGSLSDYVQEIGRAARNHDKVPIGLAVTDYLRSDMRYAQTLWGLSGLRHYQLKAMAARLYRMTQQKDSRELTIEPETFAYMFDDTGLDNRVKSGLMLLAADLVQRFGFDVLEVNAQSLFSTQYIMVPDSLKRLFLPMFRDCIRLMNDRFTQHELAYGNSAAVETRKTGDIYEIDMANLWENKFSRVSFAQFKKQFFTGELFCSLPGFSGSFDRVVPQMKLVVDYSGAAYEDISGRFAVLANALQNTFNALKAKFGGKPFTANDFTKVFRSEFNCSARNEYVTMLLELFSYPHMDMGAAPKEQWKFIEKRKDAATPGMGYSLRGAKHEYLAANLIRFFQQCAPNTDDGRFVAYISISRSADKICYQQLIASMLQLFDMAFCEYTGGRNPHVNVKVNDPEKLKRLSSNDYAYRNAVLTDIENRHARAKLIMNRFLGGEMNDAARWEIIENYFLGHDDVVDKLLDVQSEPDTTSVFDGFSLEGCDVNLTPWSEGEETLPWCQEFSANEAIQPELIGGVLRMGEVDYPLHYVWTSRKVLLPDAVLPDEAVAALSNAGYTVFDIRDPQYDLIK